ncbi:hypothetical protein HER12_000270 [Spiroplasma platyhelix PALS-1]|uniref:Type IV secretion system DNA-binding domain-containing protein n=1 Tax=Spiroplasma platyhelix PALS-1 TaxID=1276218 RepID=A0A846U052_9MOLU|nr:hypothetical protein [Spiroplasma platyhelix PALS-1]NKE38404.1 type IV secretion system DNA-binding domain-containing protein [Spiroplasma platyhelix PALS-1]UJB29291.1 hypothetical protein SPLAT_v1c05270 [Spiroplasma platyhelix PALS-1]
MLIGATGSGKTTTALLIVKQLIERLNQTVIIIDGKGDHDLIDKIKLIDSNAFIWTIRGIKEYNPLATDNSVILVDKIMSLFNFSEAHYEAIAHNYLLLIVKSLQNAKIPTTFHNIVKYFSLSSLKKIIKKDSIEYDHYLSFTNNEKDINGLMHRLSVYMQNLGTSVGKNNSLSSLVNNHKIILFSLNSLNYPQLASNVGKLIVQDLKEFASLKPKEQRINVILDEFNVFASDTIINLINKTRSFNYQVFLCFQTLNDLKINRTNLTDTIFGNCGNIIAHNLKDPNSAEYIAKVFGTQTTDKQTKQTDKTEKTGKGSTREVEEYIVHPNELKNLKIGEAYCKILLPSSKQLIYKIIIKEDKKA